MNKVKKPKVATSIPEWATFLQRQLGISDADPNRSSKIWDADIANANWRFSSGSDLSEKDYLLLRVIWHHWEEIGDFKHYMRDNPALTREEYNNPITYTGYVTPENDALAKEIYSELEPSFRGYLNDIRSNKDGTRPTSSCGLYFSTRYWQALVSSKVKENYTDVEAAALPSKVWKTGNSAGSSPSSSDATSVNAITASMAKTSISEPPRTPARSRAQHQMETPAVPKSYPAVGGMQNPASSDETYVNTALLMLLQALTLSMAQRGNSFDGRLDFGQLDWLADRLPLKLYRRQSEGQAVELMEARVDGYLCKRRYEGGKLRFNNVPLAIVEAKACVRSAGGSAIRWQESAEMACWVSSLDERYEHNGLLQSSTSGRKRYVHPFY